MLLLINLSYTCCLILLKWHHKRAMSNLYKIRQFVVKDRLHGTGTLSEESKMLQCFISCQSGVVSKTTKVYASMNLSGRLLFQHIGNKLLSLCFPFFSLSLTEEHNDKIPICAYTTTMHSTKLWRNCDRRIENFQVTVHLHVTTF